jgi:trimeric autotransporter adhesin
MIRPIRTLNWPALEKLYEVIGRRMYLKRLFATLLVTLGYMGSAALPVTGYAQAVQGNPRAARIIEPVDESDLVPLKGNVHPLAQPRSDRGAVSESAPTGRVILVLRRSAAQQAALNEYLASVQNASSPNYHKWLTPAEFGAAYGVGDSDLQTVQSWLQGHGFKIEKTPQGRNVIEFSGNIGELESAFHTSIHSFEVNGETHLANVSDPKIPAALVPVIQGVAHLNDFQPKAQSKLGATGTYDAATKSIKPDFTLFNGTTPLLYTDPADAATIYDTPNATLNANYTGTTYDGTGINIGIAGDSNITLPYVANYRVAFLGEAAATANIPTVVVDGNDPGVNGDQIEGLLDNEIAGGLAPKASIYFYTSSNTDLQSGLFDSIFRAVDDNVVSILNISFGECEANMGTAGNATILEVNEQAAAQGISMVVSTGDSGSAGCDPSGAPAAQYGLAVNALASTPYSIAVGGTDFDGLPSAFATYASATTSGSAPYYRTALKYIPESPWNDSTNVNTTIDNNSALDLGGSTNVIAAGGGASSVYTKPSFQTALTPNDSARDLPDVSFLAANGLYQATWVVCAETAPFGPDCQTSGGQFVDGARFSGFGGTSTSAPAFSGILALVEQKVGARLGQADYILYQLASSKYASVFHDITTGDNSVNCVGGSTDCGGNNFMTGFNAGPGYDQASGLGSIDVANLVADWNSVALTSTTTSFSINGSTTPANVTHGTALTFKASVTPPTATGVAGIVDTANEISGGAQNNGQLPINLTGGSGSVIYNGLPGGTYTVYARYGGDVTDAASTSTPAINVTIAPEASSTALTVSAYDPSTGNPIAGGLSALPYGTEVFLDAQVYGTAEGASASQGFATGSVVFTDGGTPLGQAPLSSSSTASYPPISGESFPAYSVGAHSLVAKYAGDASYSANTSVAVPFTVVKASTSLVNIASAYSIPSAASITITVTVSSISVGVAPTGSVTLIANGSSLGTFTNLAPAGGAASQVKVNLQGSQLIAGSNTIAVSYSGDGNYTGSTGTIVINVSPSKFTLANSGALILTAGAATANTATIKASPTNSFVGVINLVCAVTAEPTAATSPATCSVPSTVDIAGSSAVTGTLTVATTAATTPGVYAITVTGTDAATGTITASTTVNVTVTAPANPSFALTNSGNLTIAPGTVSGNTATITVTPSGGLSGAVTLACAVTTSIASPNDSPTCSVTPSVSITGSSAATATLTVNSTAATTAALRNPLHKTFVPAGGALLVIALFFGVPVRRRWNYLAALLVAMTFASVLGCGSSTTTKTNPGNPGTTAGSYLVTITGTSAGVTTQTTTVTVIVN